MIFGGNNIRHTTRLLAIIMLCAAFTMNAVAVFALAITIGYDEIDEFDYAAYNEVYLEEEVDTYELQELYVTESQNQIPEEIEQVDEMHTEEYIVQSGDTLWSIAETVYCDGSMYGSLIELNEINNEDSIYVGQSIKYYTQEATIEAACIQYSNLKAEEKKQQQQKQTTQNTSSSGDSGSARNYQVPSADSMTYEGQFFITGYDPWCAHCCGKSNAITASGTKASPGRTIATSKKYPFGTKLYIEGYGIYTVEDRGVSDGVIDIAAESHEACRWLTKHNVNVYIVNE